MESSAINNHFVFFVGLKFNVYIVKILISLHIQNEFLEILLELCEEKLQKTTQKCVHNDVLFAHLIDETMIFDKELQTFHHDPEMNCIRILLEEPYLKQWIDLEKKCTDY